MSALTWYTVWTTPYEQLRATWQFQGASPTSMRHSIDVYLIGCLMVEISSPFQDVQARSASNELLRRLVSADLESNPPSRQELKDLLYASEQGLQPVQVTAWLER
jgi:hypothetical protein